MATKITLPKLSDTMEEGKILRWLKRVGDQIAPGDVVAEVETDKADMEIEATDGGVLTEIRVREGESAEVGAVLAVLDEQMPGAAERGPGAAEAGSGAGGQGPAEGSADGETAEGDAGQQEQEEEDPGQEEQVKRTPTNGGGEPERPPSAGRDPRAARRPSAPASPSPPSRAREVSQESTPMRLRASPLAQRLARERGVDLAQVQGSGAEGKVVARDLETPVAARAVPGRPADAQPSPRLPAAEALKSGMQPLSKMRQTIARRMSEAKNGVPHFYVVAEIDMGEAERLLEALKLQVDPKITVSHLLIKATAMALEQHSRLNGLWADGAIDIRDAVNIGLAVAVEDGLILPVIHGCDKLSLAELAAEARRLVSAAREGRFSGDDLKGATFSISNLGMLDVDEFSAIINPPQAAILAVASIKDRAVVRGGQLAVGRTMRLTLSCDHRQLNGVEGARFLETLKAILENPLRLVV